MKRVITRATAAVGAAVLLVPIGAAAMAGTTYECDDYDCYEVEYPEFEDLITSISVTDMKLVKSGTSQVKVTLKFADPGIDYEIDEDLSWLTFESDIDSDQTGMIDFEETAPGVLTAIGRGPNDLQTGKWWIDSIHVWIDYPETGASSYYDDTWVASFQVKRSTSLTLNAAPEPIKKGKSLTVSGSLKYLNTGKQYVSTDAYYAPYKGKTVKIYFDPTGASPKKYMGSATTNSKGVYSKKFTAKQSGTWTAEFAGNSTYWKSTSAGDGVKVK